MKNLLFFGMASLFVLAITIFGGSAAGQERDGNESAREKLIGAWRLAWLEEPDAEGKIHRVDCTGLLVYTRDGHMSVQVMYRNPQTGGQGGPVQYAQGGYEASFGTYKIEEGERTFMFHVEGAMVRSLIGKDLPRAFEITGNQMIAHSTDAKEHWRVAWEHY